MFDFPFSRSFTCFDDSDVGATCPPWAAIFAFRMHFHFVRAFVFSCFLIPGVGKAAMADLCPRACRPSWGKPPGTYARTGRPLMANLCQRSLPVVFRANFGGYFFGVVLDSGAGRPQATGGRFVRMSFSLCNAGSNPGPAEGPRPRSG